MNKKTTTKTTPKAKKSKQTNQTYNCNFKDNEVLKLITFGGCGNSCLLIWRPKKRLEKYLIKDDLSDSEN